MKVNGKPLKGPQVHVLTIPYGESPDDFLVFKFKPLTRHDDFEKIMSRPKPPSIQKPGGVVHHNFDDPRFKSAWDDWAEKKIHWEFLQSISATEGLEWETVKLSDPNSWKNWKDELDDQFGTAVHNRIFGAYLEANSLSEDKIEECRKRFLASMESDQPANMSSPISVLPNTPSGEPAKDSK